MYEQNMSAENMEKCEKVDHVSSREVKQIITGKKVHRC